MKLTKEDLKAAGAITNWLHDEGFIDKAHVSYRRITNRVASALAEQREKSATFAETKYHGLARPDGPEVKAGLAIAAAIRNGSTQP